MTSNYEAITKHNGRQLGLDTASRPTNQMSIDMNQLLKLASITLTQFLAQNLPKLSEDWWMRQVKGKLTYQQQRLVEERGIDRLEQLDLAALLRVLDQNWFDLKEILNLPYEGRNWVKEMQSIRNKWAHISTEEVPAKESYRDADTLGRLLKMIGANEDTQQEVETYQELQVVAMAPKSQKTETTEELPPSPVTPAVPEKKESTSTTLFIPGSMVALVSQPGDIFPIIEVLTGGHETSYKVFHNASFVTYYESQLQAAVIGNEPIEPMDVQMLHAYLTSLQLLSPSTSNLFSLRSGRINFVPYQYRPVLKIIQADRPRLLIADEVGVGKTIEAGLIIKELRARMDIQSVLIICPKALVAERKWQTEMKRFDEQFTHLDGKLLRHCIRETHLDGEWPEQYAKSILPFSLINEKLIHGQPGKGAKKQRGLLELDPPPEFDLVIVDEAHNIRNTDTHLHQAVRYFCDHSQAAIFLTATPVQLGSNDLFTLLNALRPDLVIDHASFEQMAEPNPMINEAVRFCRAAEENWQIDVREQLNLVAQTQWGRLFLSETPAFQSVYDSLEGNSETGTMNDDDRVALVHALEALYTFSSLINRTRRRDIGEFTTRKPQTLNIPFTTPQQALHDDLLELIAEILEYCHGSQNVRFMMTTIRRQAASCIYGLAPTLRDILNHNLSKIHEVEVEDDYELDPERGLEFLDRVKGKIESIIRRANNLDTKDPKVEAFIQVLQDKGEMEKNKSLVFSTFRHTLGYLEKQVKKTHLRYGLIHGDIADNDRAELRHRFSLPKEDPDALDVLLSSEVGCEGLDFQFCDLLVNYDLPWNPMRVEQRIGRIDRYGQTSETVSIVNMITPNTVDADIYDRCLMRIGVFNSAIGASEEILGDITEQIKNIAENYKLTSEERKAQMKQIADNELRKIQEEQKLEAKDAELFGLSVPKQSWENDIEEAESFWLSPSALQECVEIYLEKITKDKNHILGEKQLKTLRLKREARGLLLNDLKRQPRSTDPERRQWEKWLKGEKPTISITFDQATAADSPDCAYLNVLHPLVRQAAGSHRSSDPVEAHLQASSPSIEAGTYPFAIYQWKKHGVKEDEILQAIALDLQLEDLLMDLIPGAQNAAPHPTITQEDRQSLEDRQYTQWRKARTKHVTENHTIIEQRRQSLAVSHRARRKLLNDQISDASDAKIRRMKESQLANAEADFQRHNAKLDEARRSADVHSTPIAVGTITICNK